ncbi:hypothetical protein, variant [Aphanomyces invadans]|uniref:Uncharacterized protein n=1 Tax=Aphanomyces invadans TaxID=157072 RepID=A0A024U617_9STRA|nr:hypothetical protein, variant [Aphanomyces invadans]ETW01048.1 hypothetical protein, variant [Aphanomyces invadans]|eukprot:XP_008870046.1 hypothetical protein, variant [Aphanomyces invadans]
MDSVSLGGSVTIEVTGPHIDKTARLQSIALSAVFASVKMDGLDSAPYPGAKAVRGDIALNTRIPRDLHFRQSLRPRDFAIEATVRTKAEHRVEPQPPSRSLRGTKKTRPTRAHDSVHTLRQMWNRCGDECTLSDASTCRSKEMLQNAHDLAVKRAISLASEEVVAADEYAAACRAQKMVEYRHHRCLKGTWNPSNHLLYLCEP